MTTRHPLSGTLPACAVIAAIGWTGWAAAQAKEVKVAVVVPLSGAWARNGELHLKGAQLAVEDINAAGGIKALGGAKMTLIVADSGDSTEKAKNAAQRLLSQNRDLVGGTGAFVHTLIEPAIALGTLAHGQAHNDHRDSTLRALGTRTYRQNQPDDDTVE